MKIVYLHQYFTRPSESGGTRSYEMAKRLVARGHEVHMLTSDRGGKFPDGRWRTELIDGVTVHWIGVAYSGTMSFKRRIAAFLEFAVRSASRARKLRGDVVFATSTPLTIALPGIYATMFSKRPLVLEVRDLWPDVPIALGVLKNPLVIFLARGLEKLSYRRSAAIVALSPGMKAGVVAAGYPAHRVHVIPNASDVDLFAGHDAAAAEWRRSYDWLGDRPLVAHCGTLGFVNNINYMVEIAAEVVSTASEIRFVTLGSGVEKDNVRRRAIDLGVLDVNFFMLPALPKSEVPVVFRACTVSTCFVAPIKELENNSANKVFDSFAAGKPVAINYGGWQADLLEESGAGVRLSSTTAAVAARQLVDFLRDDYRLASASDASAMLGATRFNRQTLAQQLIAVLEEVNEE